MTQKIIPGGAHGRATAGKSPEELETQSQEYHEDVEAIKDAILRQFGAGTDIGELVYTAMVEAQREVADGYTLLDNRPGSWESAGLSSLMDGVQAQLNAESN
ncbi:MULTISPECIES: hypothetical protein [Paenarthrobacter]|uniref:Uncharacterized protein n=1 Tax=Paenarthrobacter ureafaciens TaxID=37931 RepID=A0AAX3EQN0_PAEUR|nr:MULTISPECIES: hypothetical protein [Paenarthrobacter]MDO5867110.1 hypothetical protein [Paenarthrobacter sp. SD-2]MDO5878364.1 hypothetical protein [Paenarthrobacter sp. SD-1]UYV95591.1 hypothetical protein NL395_23285 [Paenarthrobacter ureafaciens]UYW00275.1 hypothetical protein NL394_24095 [Paenarthrobacter ureafaciens]